MTKINIQGPGVSLPDGNLQVDNPLDNTLQVVKDTAGTGSPLELSTDLVSVSSTLQIATDDTIYIDAEDSLGNNRFTVSRTVGQQQVNIDFASNPTLSETVGAFRTYKDGVNLTETITIQRNGEVDFSSKVGIISSEQCPLEIESTGVGGGIALMDNTTTDNQSVGVGALGDNLCFRSGGSVAGNMRLDSNGNLGINQNTPTARLQVKGAGTTVGTTSLLVQNSAGSSALSINDGLNTTFGGSVTSTGQGFATTGSSPTNDGFYTLYNGNIRYYVNLNGFLKSTSQLISDTNGAGTINASAILQANSTTQGFLPPRMTTAQKLAIATPAAGLMVYDTDLNKLCVYTTAWETITSV